LAHVAWLLPLPPSKVKANESSRVVDASSESVGCLVRLQPLRALSVRKPSVVER
jgi:hypothetical protein